MIDFVEVQMEKLMDRRNFLKSSLIGSGTFFLGSTFLSYAQKADTQMIINDPAFNAADFARKLRVFVLEHGEFWDVKHVVQVVAKSHANAIRCDVGIYRGCVTMYQSKFLPHHPELGKKDRLEELINECKKYGIVVFPYNAFYGRLWSETYQSHSEWAIQNPDGSTIDVACQNNPDYVSTYASACKEIVQNYDVAGMYFDGPGELGNTRLPDGKIKHQYCFCNHCQNVYFRKFNQLMPMNLSSEYKPEFRRDMLEVHMHGMEFFTSEVSRSIKSVGNFPVLINLCDPINRFIRHGSSKYTDGALAAEFGRSDNFMNALMRLKIGSTLGKVAWSYCPPGPHEKLVTYKNLETKIFGLMQIVHGGTPIIETLQAFLYDETAISDVKELFDYIEKNEELYFDFKPVPYIALHTSKQTAKYFSSHDPTTRSGHWENDYFKGSFVSLTHQHIQFDTILDQHLGMDNLKKYNALFLPNITCLSNDQVDHIKAFVLEGGGLIATHNTSLYDEVGDRRVDFALKELFHVSFQSEQKLNFGRLGEGDPYLHIIKNHPVTKKIAIDKLIYCERESFPVVDIISGGEVLADMYMANTGESYEPIKFLSNAPSGVVASYYGKGRVVYIAPPLDKVYFRREFRLIRQLFNNAVNWVAKGEEPFMIAAPICVTTHITKHKNKKALHLINYVGNRQENRYSKVEWIAPLYNIEIKIKKTTDKEKLLRTSLLRTRKELSFITEDSFFRLNIEELNDYECVILEYESV